MLHCVITADLVQSTQRHLAQRTLTTRLNSVFDGLQNFLDPKDVLLPFTVFQGDSYQGVLAGTQHALHAMLYLRCAVRGELELDVRQALGIGRTEQIVDQSALASTGQAFVRSGRLLETMTSNRKQSRRISVDSGDEGFNGEFNVHFELLEAIATDWTDRECEAVFLKLHQWTQTDIADYLGINQSAVHKRLKAAKWSAVECLLNRWQTAASLAFPVQDTKFNE